MKMMTAALGAALLGTAVPAAADAGHDAIGRAGDPQKMGRTVEIEATDDMRFAPSRITVKRGETVRFVVHNRGSIRHELVLGTLAELQEHAKLMRRFPNMEHDEENEADIAPGRSAAIVWQFTRAGEVPFACLMPGHMEAGMHGLIRVTD